MDLPLQKWESSFFIPEIANAYYYQIFYGNRPSRDSGLKTCGNGTLHKIIDCLPRDGVSAITQGSSFMQGTDRKWRMMSFRNANVCWMLAYKHALKTTLQSQFNK